MVRLRNWLSTLRLASSSSAKPSVSADETIRQLQGRCSELEQRLAWSDEQLKKRSELLYELQRHYASEHYQLAETMRNLRIEEMRLAGTIADRDTILNRARAVQTRLRELKARLQEHEPVDDWHFDAAPIIIDFEEMRNDARRKDS